MAVNQRDLASEMMKEITEPGIPAIPLLYPTTWNGRSIEEGTGRVGGEVSTPTRKEVKMSEPTSSTNSIEEILAAIARQGAEVFNLQTKKADLQSQNADAVRSVEEDRLANSQQKYRGELEAQNAGIAVRNQLGNNPNDPDSLLAMLTADFEQNTREARAQRDAIVQKKQVGLFDNPLEFLWNQITLPDDINAMKATESKAEFAKEKIAQMQAMTTASAQAQQATAKTLTEAGMVAQAKIDRVKLDNEIRDMDIKAVGDNVEAVKTLQSNSATELATKLQIINIKNAQAHLALAETQNTREQWKFEKMKDDEESIQKEAKIMSIGAAQSGLSGMDARQIEYLIKNKQLSPVQAQELRARGERYLQQKAAGIATPSPALGNTPGESFLSLAKTGGMDQPQYQPIKDYMSTLWDRAEKVVSMKPGYKANSPASLQDIAEEVNRIITGTDAKGKVDFKRSEMYMQWKNMETTGNPYQVKDLKDFANLPAIKSNVLYESILAPALAAGNTSLKASTVDALIFDAMAKGKITPEQAARGVTDLYTATSAAQYIASGMMQMNLPMPAKYIVKKDNWATGWTDEIDLKNFSSNYDYYREVQLRQVNMVRGGTQ